MEGAKQIVFVGIDVMKLLCALLIVYLHTYNHDWGLIGDWVHINLASIGVPFFFIVSGYFYTRGLQNSANKWNYLQNYLKRVICMYLFWSVITLPVAWMNICIAHGEYSLFMKVLYIIRCFFLTGSIGIYWYVLALIYNSVIMYYALKWKRKHLMYIFSLLFFIIGVLYNGGGINDTFIEKAIHVAIGSERNFLNVGLFYMCIGSFIFEKNIILDKNLCILLFICCLGISSWQNSVSAYRIMQFPLAVLLFLFASQQRFAITEDMSMKMRKWSTAIYLVHFPFILVFDFYLRKGTIIDFPLSVAIALILFYVISFLLPRQYVKMIFGS